MKPCWWDWCSKPTCAGLLCFEVFFLFPSLLGLWLLEELEELDDWELSVTGLLILGRDTELPRELVRNEIRKHKGHCAKLGMRNLEVPHSTFTATEFQWFVNQVSNHIVDQEAVFRAPKDKFSCCSLIFWARVSLTSFMPISPVQCMCVPGWRSCQHLTLWEFDQDLGINQELAKIFQDLVYENIVYFLQDVRIWSGSWSCQDLAKILQDQSNHIILNSCQDLG